MPLTTETKTLRLDLPPEGFRLERGGVLSEINIAYETCGTLSAAKDNVIFICHALTGDAHVAGYHNPADEKSAGWWANMIKPGGGIDTDKFHVVCANILGGCKGTTGPSSTNPATGKPYGKDFPRITVRDIVSVHKLFLEQIGFAKISAVIGGSFGGMQALEMSLAFPGFADKCVCIASGGTVTTQALAFDVVGRAAITSDPNFKGGDYYDGGARPDAGLAQARRLAHITYLSEEILKMKFGREKRPETEQFQIESYLSHQGDKFIARFDANSYIRITEAMDEYDVAAGYSSLAGSIARSLSKTAFIALSSDWLFFPEQSRALTSAYLSAKKEATYFCLNAPAGHDSFLTHIDELRDVMAAFLTLENSATREAKSAEKSDDYDRLLDMMPPDASSVLDLACNEGVLLNRALGRKPGLRRVGLDISGKALIPVMRSGSGAILADIDDDLDMIPDDSFDCVFLSESLQVLRNPAKALTRLLRIAPVALVSFPNFGLWKIRLSLLFKGRMPKTKRLPHSWYDTPNIHLCTFGDFKGLCRETGCSIEMTGCLATHFTGKLLNFLGLKNLGSSRVIARISRK